MAKTGNDRQRKSREEALHWFMKINSGEATDADRENHAVWLSVDAFNRAEYDGLAGIWSDLDRIPDPRSAMPLEVARRSYSVSRRGLLAGGTIGLAAAAAFVVAGPPDFLTRDHFTGTGEVRTIALADGSAVELDADTAIAVNYTQGARTIRLLRGRAFFTVARDVARPFSVFAGDGKTTALGTRFIVHEWAGSVTVTVQESAVSVTGPDKADAVVQAGEYISYDDRRLGKLQAADVDSDIAWRRGKLIFEDRPLRQVLADVNRYRSGIIRVTDSRLLDMRVSGIFDVRNPDGVLDAISRTLPVRTFRLSRYLVVLYPA